MSVYIYIYIYTYTRSLLIAEPWIQDAPHHFWKPFFKKGALLPQFIRDLVELNGIYWDFLWIYQESSRTSAAARTHSPVVLLKLQAKWFEMAGSCCFPMVEILVVWAHVPSPKPSPILRRRMFRGFPHCRASSARCGGRFASQRLPGYWIYMGYSNIWPFRKLGENDD